MPFGWNTEENGSGTSYADGYQYSADDYLVLYTNWSPIVYTVHFNGNGATSGSMDDQHFVYDQPQNLRLNEFERVGYEFVGWSRSETSSVISYTNGQSVNNLSISSKIL